MTHTHLEIFDSVFSVHTVETDMLLVNIILDRKYDIPKWLYQYITEDVLITIIANSDNTDEFREFIKTIRTECIFNDKYLSLLFIDSLDLFHYTIIINPKKFYRYAIGYMDNIDSSFIIRLIGFYVEYYNKIAPKEYYYLLSYTLVKSSDLNANFKRLFCSQIYTLYMPIINRLKTYHSQYIFDMFFKGLYNTYEHIIINEYINDYTFSIEVNPCELLTYYWSKGGTYIPNNLDLNHYSVYMSLVNRTNHFPEYSDDLVNALSTYGNRLSEDVKSEIMDSLRNNISNIKLLTWDITDEERLYVRDTYMTYHKSNIKDMDFVKYWNIIHPDRELIPYNEYKNFIVRGGKINIEYVQIDNIDDFIEFIMKYLSDEELKDYFLKDVKIHFFNKEVSLLEYTINGYINHNKSSNILERFYSIVLSNTDIVDSILDKSYTTYSKLISRTSLDTLELISRYPQLVKYQTAFPAVIIFCVTKSNPESIQYIPWKYLPQELILNKIASSGYFPITLDEKDSDNVKYHDPAKYVNTTKLLNSMKVGKGVGYCLDYIFPEYTKIILKTLLETNK